ncbi:imidazole glycerol phosphate synthase subunit HisH [Pseudothermotoga thermarum]|uniref:Imidazole glycerol phosphate synthase subunit HisH n=1 Tax=Pseudothermotoga thermarum DSM 5069 TaxID=688269 RepID=F7YYR9_9THEM|nr:imidazole glycerol phosphate synthase subunit HisH [Pseudothermotoga thermarum]AEH51107.1 imidazole glycerol phosphate synthase subunit hisH [Pseudothermotoga thermarum DSM 5069]
MGKICIVDYGVGNLRSVTKALEKVGAEVVVTSERNVLKFHDVVVLPGVGSFDAAIVNLQRQNLMDVLMEKVKNGFVFGICLGYQLLYESSEEGVEKGLGILKGKVCRFPTKSGLKVPHMGWNKITVVKSSSILSEFSDKYVYFVHSYYVVNFDRSVVAAVCNYGINFDAAVETENIFATQFHPEKSGKVGLKILENFLKVVKKRWL